MGLTQATALLESLTARGLVLEAKDGKILAGPRVLVTAEDGAAIRTHKEALLVLLARPDEETMIALAERAFLDPPSFNHGVIDLGNGMGVEYEVRQSVLVRLEGIGVAAFSPADIASLDACLAQALARREASLAPPTPLQTPGATPGAGEKGCGARNGTVRQGRLFEAGEGDAR